MVSVSLTGSHYYVRVDGVVVYMTTELAGAYRVAVSYGYTGPMIHMIPTHMGAMWEVRAGEWAQKFLDYGVAFRTACGMGECVLM